MPDPPLPADFDPERDVLLRLEKGAQGERAQLFGRVPRELQGEFAVLDWEAARAISRDRAQAAFLAWIGDIRRSDQPLESEKFLGAAVAALLPEAWRPVIDGCLGRWVIEAQDGLDACLVPWEAWIHDRAPVITERAPLLRLLDGDDARSPLPVRSKSARVLVLVGSTRSKAHQTGAARDLAGELREIEQAIAPFGVVVTASATGEVPGYATAGRVRAIGSHAALLRLLGEGFHVVHYVGHSREEFHAGAVGLDFDEPVGMVSAQDLARGLAGSCTRLLVLNACRVPDPMARALGACVDQVVAMGARVPFDSLATWVGDFYRTLFEHQRPVSEAVAAARRAIGKHAGTRRWVPGHWTRSLKDGPLLSPRAFALERHRAAVIADHGPYLGALAGFSPSEDAIEELAIELELDPLAIAAKGVGNERILDRSWTIQDLVHRARDLAPTGRVRFVLKAHPGGGKTTSLRKLARGLAQEGSLVPYYESLADWPREGGRLVPFWRAIEARSESLAQALRVEAASGRLVLLLDGLDECRDASRVAHFLNHDLPEGDGITIVATRIIFPREALAKWSAIEAQLAPLNHSEQLELLERWFRHLDLERPDDHARQLASHMQGTPFLREMAGTPLYLTLAALLWSDPDQRQRPKDEPHQLYEQCLTYLLERLYKSDPGPAAPATGHAPPAPALAVRLLRLVALHGIQHGRASIEPKSGRDPLGLRGVGSQDALSSFFGPDISRLEIDVERWCGLDHRIDHLLESIQHRTGVLEGNRTLGRWRFPHKTFREALASLALRELYQHRGLKGLQGYLAACGLESAGEEALSSWAEVLAITTGWIGADERDAWVRWLHRQHPRLGLRALAFGPGVSAETIIAVLELSAERSERWEAYRKAIDAALTPVAAVDLIEALVAALGRIHGQQPARGFKGGPVPDYAFLDDALRALADEHVDLEAAATRVRDRILDALHEPKVDKLAALFTTVPARAPAASDAGLERTEPLWAKVPAGIFRMGSPKKERRRRKNEDQVTVTFNAPFWIARTAVTLAQYRLFDPDKTHRWGDDRDLPVTEVTWYEAALFCRWLERHGAALRPKGAEGLVFQLPSEAMWEYACRDAPGMREEDNQGYPRFVNGNNDTALAAVGWFRSNSASKVHPVATRDPAPRLGLYDLHGNVWEWCADAYQDALWSGQDPRGPIAASDDARRVLRGGSYWDVTGSCRAAFRNDRHPASCDDGFGFRVVLAPRPPRR